MWEKTLERNGHIIVVGVLAVMAFFGAGLAANIDTGSGGNAGQGVNVTDGYTAGVVKFSGGWVNGNADDNTNVTSFSFVLKKEADGEGTSTVTNENTVIYSQLTGAANSNWVQCFVSATPQQGTVSCLLTGQQQKPLSGVTGVSVVAYDNNGTVTPPVDEYAELSASATVIGASSDTFLVDDGELYRVVTWENTNGTSLDPDGSITVNDATIDVEYLVVAGGGGGGRYGGGGGGGGLLTNVGAEELTLPLGSATVRVGAGGIGHVGNAQSGGTAGSGGESAIAGVTAQGGGGGGNYANCNCPREGAAGGSGGGAGTNGPSFSAQINSGGAGVEGQGYNGGINETGYALRGGGGGGAGGSGFAGNAGGHGGPGVPSAITGTLTYFAGGGGGTGGQRTVSSLGGIGGGGLGPHKGRVVSSSEVDGVDGLGGGGGGAADNRLDGTIWRAGNGGDGIVILRWRV